MSVNSFAEVIAACVDENIDLVQAEGVQRLIDDKNHHLDRAYRLEDSLEAANKRIENADSEVARISRANAELSQRNSDLLTKIDKLKAQLVDFDIISNDREVLRQTAAMHEERESTAMAMLDNVIKCMGVQSVEIE